MQIISGNQNEFDNGSRFATLLKPIKDLASNWDIDIAESLTDYLGYDLIT